MPHLVDVDVVHGRVQRVPGPSPGIARQIPKRLILTEANGDPAENDIELLAFLTAPGTLAITINGQTVTKDAPAGMTSMKTPLQAGTPQLTLTRSGSPVIALTGGIASYGPAGMPSGVLDLTYWSGSASKDGTCGLTLP